MESIINSEGFSLAHKLRGGHICRVIIILSLKSVLAHWLRGGNICLEIIILSQGFSLVHCLPEGYICLETHYFFDKVLAGKFVARGSQMLGN